VRLGPERVALPDQGQYVIGAHVTSPSLVSMTLGVRVTVDAFGIEKEFLRDLLREVADGRSQLPEFQRGWVWPDRGIAALLASISLAIRWAP